jgi:hypothetical protein
MMLRLRTIRKTKSPPSLCDFTILCSFYALSHPPFAVALLPYLRGQRTPQESQDFQSEVTGLTS